MTEPVLMEVLTGTRDSQRAERLRRLMSFPLLTFDPVADFEAAAGRLPTMPGRRHYPKRSVGLPEHQLSGNCDNA
ncbi:MAG: hypothetical protein JWN81_2732 [Solirubrobacterales bacterium]|nr:hypothetical protein [Solirubrobacterales bacterium]